MLIHPHKARLNKILIRPERHKLFDMFPKFYKKRAGIVRLAGDSRYRVREFFMDKAYWRVYRNLLMDKYKITNKKNINYFY